MILTGTNTNINLLSTAAYSHNTVTITSAQSSAQAGTLDASSAVNFRSDGVKVYNVNFENSFGNGHQVSLPPIKI